MSILPNTPKFNIVAETIAMNCRSVEEVHLDKCLLQKVSFSIIKNYTIIRKNVRAISQIFEGS